jgi:membrane protease YdiL (CAAX protease family)
MTERREIGWGVLLPALVVPFLGSLVYFVWMPEGAVGKTAYTLTKLFTIVYPLLFLKRIGLGGLTRREARKTDWPGWKVVAVTGLLSGIAIAALGTVLMMTPLGEIVRAGAGEVTERAEGLGFKEHFVLFAVFISVLHSLIEEYYWRWFAYGHLRKICGRGAGHLIAALGFAAHHLVITLQFFPAPLAIFLAVGVALGGVIWTLMYEWHGNVAGCWLSHFVVDVFIMVIGYQLIMG